MTKTNWILVAIVLALILFIVLMKCTVSKDVLPASKTDTLTRWEVKDSLYVSSLLTKKDQEYSNLDKHLRDSIAGIYRITTKQINELLQANLKAESEVPAIDSAVIEVAPSPVKNCPPIVKSMTQRYKNKWYDATATTGERPRLLLKVYDTLTVIQHEVTTGNIFNRQRYHQLDISLSNPVNIISGVRSFKVTAPKPKKFGIGVQVGYGWQSGLRPSIYAGVGIQYSIIRF